jgi:hypothetical protein
MGNYRKSQTPQTLGLHGRHIQNMRREVEALPMLVKGQDMSLIQFNSNNLIEFKFLRPVQKLMAVPFH